MFFKEPEKRITSFEAIKHPYFTKSGPAKKVEKKVEKKNDDSGEDEIIENE